MGLLTPKHMEFKKVANPNAMPKADKAGWRNAKQVARNAAAQRDEAKARADRKADKRRKAADKTAKRKAAQKAAVAAERARRKREGR
jgi:hypothetical protein